MIIHRKNTGNMPRRAFLGVGAAAMAGAILSSRHSIIAVAAKETVPTDIHIVQFSNSGQRQGIITVKTIVKPESEWKKQLTDDAFFITREEGTERPYSGAYWNNHEKGLYHCVCCGTPNFSSETKFESGTGWPSFWQVLAKENVRQSSDSSLGMDRTAVSCPRCDAHLGHVFDDGPRPTGLRYCMNSVALNFVKSA